MRDGVGPHLILRGLVGGRPHHAGGFEVSRVGRHLRGQHLQEGMSLGNLRAACERIGRVRVVLDIHVVDEAQVVIEVPVVGLLRMPNSASSMARCGMPAPSGGWGARKFEPNS